MRSYIFPKKLNCISFISDKINSEKLGRMRSYGTVRQVHSREQYLDDTFYFGQQIEII